MSFWEHISIDDEDYEPGTILEARPEWIGELHNAISLLPLLTLRAQQTRDNSLPMNIKHHNMK